MPPDNPPADKSDKQQIAIKKILIADDRYENRYLLQALLEGNGYQIVSAENGLEVLEILKTEWVDALISDILMPGMDGFQLCRTIKEDPELKKIPFIFYSASYTEQKDREFGLSLGADEYISKPIEPEDFIQIVNTVLDQAGQQITGSEGKKPPDDLSYYTSYADTLGRKLQSKVVESEERKASARFNEEKYRMFLQNLQGIGYLLQVGNSQPLIFDGQVEEISGYHSEDFLAGTPLWETIVHHADRQKYLSNKSALGSGTAQKLSEQYRVNHKNGDIRWVHEIASSFSGLEPDTLMIQGAIYDITLQIESKEQLRISEEHYRTLFETMIEGVVYLDENGAVIDANPSAGRILGLNIEEIQGKTCLNPRWKTVREDGSPLPEDERPAMVALRTGEKRSQIMGIYNPRDNLNRWIKVNAVPRFLPGSDAPNQVYTTFEDITKEKAAHDHIKHLNRILKSLRMVNFLITGETKREILLNRICSSLTGEDGYSGIWIIADSDSGREKYQAISDNIIGDEFRDNISQEIITSWMNVEDIPDQKIVTHSLELKKFNENVTPSQRRSGVMITRLSYEETLYGMIGVCVPEAFIETPDEESLFLEI
ncbi:MAG: response regulator, partial [Methanospirillum sp.]|uniref:response regulator n=1 Tax=Methanospirillum sp. TaxID=45200 RepID=UPI002370B885